MDDSWVADFAAALEGRGGVAFDDDVVAAPVLARLLVLARDVARASERSNAPLATYLTGRYVALRVAQGADVETALSEAAAVARELAGGGGDGG